MKQWYEELFDNYSNHYENEVFVKGTLGECDFIEQEINYNKNVRILDIGCGTGRHSLELARRGYSVTGIDLSISLLNRAKELAEKEGLNVDFHKQDARALTYKNEFDLAIMLCEGGFSLMETDEMNFVILKNATNALRDNGKLIFTALNGLFSLYHSVKEFLENNSEYNDTRFGVHSFDLMTFRNHSILDVVDDSGIKKTLKCNERYYVPSEITWMLKSLNFKSINIFGAKLGAFSRNDELTTGDFEMLVIAEK